ncbi:ATP-binding protein [Lentzea chajnantorensis]
MGRDEELRRVGDQLDRARLVTLVGPGGAGKTRLATEAAVRHRLHARGRVWFLPLAGVRAADDLVGAVLSAFDPNFTTGDPLRRGSDGMDRIAEALAAGESLLVLDNCEHLVEAAAEFTGRLLRLVPSARVLATSREPLAIEGESLCPVGPLAVPDGRADLSGYGSVRLFLDRATAVKPGFRLDESTADAVAQICRRLDGMPLALELAAARLRSMTVHQITQRLDDRFRLLTSGSRTALPRQRTLRAVVEWSWDLLTEQERELARRLSVFPAGADLAAIEQICRHDLYVLTSLVEKSIVDVLDHDEPRYRMLETIRVYAAEQLAASGETAEVVARFRDHYRRLTEDWEPLTRTARQLEVIAGYEAEHDNIVAALRGAVEDQDADAAAGLLTAVFWYWMVKGDSKRADTAVDDVLAFGDRLPADVRAALTAMRLMMQVMPGVPDAAETAAVIEDCVRAESIERFPALAIALPMLAFVSKNKDLAHREVQRAAGSSDPWARAGAEWARSFLLVDDGDLHGAAAARERAYELFSATGDRWGTAMSLGMKAAFVSQTGDNLGAIALYERGLALAQELRSTEDAVQQHWRLAVEYARLGDLGAAQRQLAEAERFVQETGNEQMSAMILYAKAEIRLRCGAVTEARELAESFRVRGTAAALGAFGEEWSAMLEARIALAEHRFADAEQGVAVAVETTSARSDMPDLAAVTEILAQVRHGQGAGDVALRLLALVKLLRGGLDLGDPGVRGLIAELGEPDAAQVPKDDALREIRKEAGLPG